MGRTSPVAGFSLNAERSEILVFAIF
jgi:hypothetical protein